MDWVGLKNEAARMLFDKDALHIYAGLLIQVAAARLSRRSLGHLLPWLVVLGFEVVNEIIDVWRGGEQGLKAWQVVSGVHDLINTLIVPTVLLLLCRHARGLFDWRDPAVETQAPRGGRQADDGGDGALATDVG